MRSSISGRTGNCEPKDATSLLHIFDDACTDNGIALSVSDVSVIRKYDLVQGECVDAEHAYDAVFFPSLSEFKTEAISYMAGYVGNAVSRKLLCRECVKALGSRVHPLLSNFLKLKDRGGLFKPTKSVHLSSIYRTCYGRVNSIGSSTQIIFKLLARMNVLLRFSIC